MLKNAQVKAKNKLPLRFFNKFSWKIVTWLAWLSCLLSLIFTPTGLWLEKLNAAYLDDLKIRTYPIQALMAVTFSLMGALILTYKPRQPVGWLLSVISFLMAVATVSRQYDVYTLLTNPGALPFGDFVGWCYLPAWMGADILSPLLILLFPTGRPLTPRWGWLLWLTAVASALILLPVGISSWNEAGIELLTSKPSKMGLFLLPVLLGVVLMAVVMVGSVVSLIVRFSRSRGEERLQLKWFTYAVALAAISAALITIGAAVQDEFLIALFNAFTYVAFSAVPAAIAIAILKYRLFDIDLIINRTLVYGSLTFGLGGFYVLVVSLLGIFLNVQGNLVVALFATGLIAVLFQPVYQRVQRGVNRLMYGERDEPYSVLSRLGQRLEETLATERILPTIVETVAHALKLPYAAIILPPKEAGEPVEREAASYTKTGSHYQGQTAELVLSYQHETVGKLVLAPRAPGEAFSPADQHLLADLVRQIGVAVHAVQLTLNLKETALALQQARERLVNTREEERRRLRRNLHDGLGPSLATLSLKAEAARDLVYQEPAESYRLMDQLIGQAQASIADIRRLVYDLRPPALDDLGLVGAIQSQLATFEQTRLSLNLSAPERLPTLPAAVEVAAYRIIQEALTNVVRHAAARNCWVRLELTQGLEITIKDDGQGLPTQLRAGVGLRSMHERAEELGGSCRVESSPQKGTLVRVSLPLPLAQNQPVLELNQVVGAS